MLGGLRVRYIGHINLRQANTISLLGEVKGKLVKRLGAHNRRSNHTTVEVGVLFRNLQDTLHLVV